jgi:TRAP-type C4-dicarboxylate transport system permease small subunit
MSRIYNGILDALAFAAAILLLAITIGIGLDVGARYLFSRPLGWMSEFVQHSMLLILFLSIGWLTRERGHVAVEILLDGMSKRYRRVMEINAALLSGAISAFLCAWAAVSTWDNYSRGVLTDGIYPIPRHWLIGVVTVGLFFTAVEFFRGATKMIVNPDVEVRQVDAEIEALALAARADTARERLT